MEQSSVQRYNFRPRNFDQGHFRCEEGELDTDDDDQEYDPLQCMTAEERRQFRQDQKDDVDHDDDTDENNPTAS